MSRTNIVCINCPKGCRMTVETENNHIKNISGYSCPIGEKYARDEFENPVRILPTTVRVINGVLPLVSVKTEKPIAKELLLDAMREIAKIEVEAPVYLGQVVKENLLDTGVDLIATRTISSQRG
ncbi:DUF1667 domain-containing protein [Iocasia frigidifontis]|uniref:DUF1667 domain-containing protein n=2 Tax=Iocasia fonsfrigidae TaxID=2682810 RepID=A0A8A7K887_9FIRM|nr:DUF1667 domain-containing protein [Iocasia fonsfrigidae]